LVSREYFGKLQLWLEIFLARSPEASRGGWKLFPFVYTAIVTPLPQLYADIEAPSWNQQQQEGRQGAGRLLPAFVFSSLYLCVSVVIFFP
jgi:hypothetical protein